MGAQCCTETADDEFDAARHHQLAHQPLNETKVNKAWLAKRGNQDPAEDKVNEIMQQQDANNDGLLDKDESKRMCIKFLERSQDDVENGVREPHGDELDSIFHQLDINQDGKLDRREVKLAMKAMWLMTRDGVHIEELTGDGDSNYTPTKKTLPAGRKKLSARKVESVWIKERGAEAEGPDEAAVQRVMKKSKSKSKAIAKSDNNHDGALTRTEAQRISKAFLKKANLDSSHVDVVFDYLDTNDDGVLDKEEIALAMKAMWLMSTDGIQLEALLDEAS